MEQITNFNGEFINLYSQENPILETGDVCYCMITNNMDYHYPLLVKGIIMQDKFCDGLNKQYFVRILEILESPNIINKFFLGQSFDIYPYVDDEIRSKKIIQVNMNFDYNVNLFKLEAFFVRNTEKKITELRSAYITLIRRDIEKMLKDIDSI